MLNSTIYTDNQSIINYNLFFQQNNFFIKKVIIVKKIKKTIYHFVSFLFQKSLIKLLSNYL